MSLAIAYSLGGILAAFGVVLSLAYTGSALATTAIGTLLPALSDTGELTTEFSTYRVAGRDRQFVVDATVALVAMPRLVSRVFMSRRRVS